MRIPRQKMFISTIGKPETIEVVKSVGNTIKPMPMTSQKPTNPMPNNNNPSLQTANKENQLKLQQQKLMEEKQNLAEQRKELDNKKKLLNLNTTYETNQTTLSY